jgi:pimeloyl-ACP methyl ester carboxylesterase
LGADLTAAEMENPDTVIRIPTLHLHGLKDEFLPLGREQLANYYDTETASLYEINYHHAMPWVKAESEELAKRIKELYDKTK